MPRGDWYTWDDLCVCVGVSVTLSLSLSLRVCGCVLDCWTVGLLEERCRFINTPHPRRLFFLLSLCVSGRSACRTLMLADMTRSETCCSPLARWLLFACRR